MANSISAEKVLNPSGVYDTCSHIVTIGHSDLVISKCMQQVTRYTFQFWIKSDDLCTVSFSCDDTFKKIFVTSSWQYFHISFDVNKISNIVLTFPPGEFWIYNTKLEVGNYNTDWSPHPEDDYLAVGELSDRVQLLVKGVSTIDHAVSMLDKINMRIENSLSRTEFEADISGIMTNINENMEQIKEGKNKWHVAVYDKNEFQKLMNVDTVPVSDYSRNDILDKLNELPVTPDNPPPTSDEPATSDDSQEITEVDDRERYDIKIFSMDNGEINPLEELLIDDNSVAMRIPSEGKVLYYYTFVKFSERTTYYEYCSFKKATLYINGIQAVSFAETDSRDVQLPFNEGWNLIEIISNEGTFSFKNPISKHENCLEMNCLVAIPTARSVKTRIRSTSILQTLEKILMEVYAYDDERYYDKNGEEKIRKVLKYSRIKQTADEINMLVQNDLGDYSQFSLTPYMMEAITRRFVVKDPMSNEEVMIIEDGVIKGDIIEARMFKTDSIRSRNYDGEIYTIQVENDEEEEQVQVPDIRQVIITGGGDVLDPTTRQKLNIEKYTILSSYIDFDPENDVIFPENGSFLDLANGNFFSQSLVVINDLTQTVDGQTKSYSNEAYFKGNIHAENSYFEGMVESNEGHIGPWHITNSALYKGSNIFADEGSENIYFGDAGLSLSDIFIFDSINNTLNLKVNSIDITSPDSYQTQTYYVTGNEPTLTGDLTKSDPSFLWNVSDYEKHVGDLCYNTDTGKTYRFEQTGVQLYKITFDSRSNLKSSDYVEIYYAYNKRQYKIKLDTSKTGRFTGNTLATSSIKIPTTQFYLHLHVTQSSVNSNYWGFAISSFTSTSGSLSSASYAECNGVQIPYYALDASLPPGSFPQTEHPYPLTETDKTWLIKIAPSNQVTTTSSNFSWVEIENAELNKVLSFMHYDATNGLVMYDSVLVNNSVDMTPSQWGSTQLNNLRGNTRLTASGLDVYYQNQIIASYGSETKFYRYVQAKTNSYGSVTQNAHWEETVRLNSTGMNIYNNSNLVATYGEETNFYKYGTSSVAATLSSEGFFINSGEVGGISITSNDIHSGDHSSYNSTNPGFYLGSVNGDFSVGNGDNYLRFYKSSNNYKFTLKTPGITISDSGFKIGDDNSYIKLENGTVSMVMSGSSVATSSDVSGASGDASSAAMVATKYLYENDGLIIAPNIGTNHNAYGDAPYIHLTTTGLDVYGKYKWSSNDSGTMKKLASYGSDTIFYAYANSSSTEANSKAVIINKDGFSIQKGKAGGVNISSEAIYGGRNSNNTDGSGFYFKNDGSFYIGNGSDRYISLSSNGTLSFELGLEGGESSGSGGGESSSSDYSSYIASTGNGLKIGTNVGSTTVAYALYTSTGLDIYAPYTISSSTTLKKTASYGSTTTFYSYDSNGNSSDAVVLDSSGLNINKGSITLGDNFEVNPDGDLTCKNATITGTLSKGSKLGSYLNIKEFSSTTAIYSGTRTNYNLHNTQGVCLESNGKFGCGASETGEGHYGWFEVTTGRLFTAHTNDSDSMRYSLLWGCYFSSSGLSNTSDYSDTVNANGRLIICHNKSIVYDMNAVSKCFTIRRDNQAVSSEREEDALLIKYGNTEVFNVKYNGKAYSNDSLLTSDERMKDIQNQSVNEYKSIFMNINPIVFKWKDMSDEKFHFGVSAQNILAISNNLGFNDLSLVDTSNPERYYANYIEVLTLGIPIIQSHEKEIESLKKQIADLKAEVTELRKKVK